MTCPTDDELDVLAQRLDNLFAMLEEEGYYTKANTAAFARKAIATLRARVRALEEITEPEFIWGAMDNVHDMDVTLDDYAKAVSRAQRAALAAIQPADPVTNAGCRLQMKAKPQEPAPVTPAEAAKVQALVDAGERMTGPLWRLILADENCIKNPCDLPTCECRQKFDRIAGPWFAALAALKDAPK